MHHWKKAAHRRDRNRAFWAAAGLLLICSVSLYTASNVIKPSDQLRKAERVGQMTGSKVSAAGDGDQSGDDYLSNGSILFAPQAGNLCRQRLIDNKTWMMRDKGYVTCDEAVSWNANVQGFPSSVSRLDAIRSSFFRK